LAPVFDNGRAWWARVEESYVEPYTACRAFQ
jgi:hypothetical protein